VIGECQFARYFGLSTEPIYSTIHGLSDFILKTYRVEVKTFASETKKPNKRCTLLVTVDDAREIPCDFYVLWSVNTDTRKDFPVGWATQHEVLTAPQGVWSQRTGLLNYGVARKKLRPLHELDAYIMRLHVIEQLDDGRTLTVNWDTSHVLAAIKIDDTPHDYVYRGRQNGLDRWFTVSDPDTPHVTYKDAVIACTKRAARDAGIGLRVPAS
jgi:hypothetical protein